MEEICQQKNLSKEYLCELISSLVAECFSKNKRYPLNKGSPKYLCYTKEKFLELFAYFLDNKISVDADTVWNIICKQTKIYLGEGVQRGALSSPQLQAIIKIFLNEQIVEKIYEYLTFLFRVDYGYLSGGDPIIPKYNNTVYIKDKKYVYLRILNKPIRKNKNNPFCQNNSSCIDTKNLNFDVKKYIEMHQIIRAESTSGKKQYDECTFDFTDLLGVAIQYNCLNKVSRRLFFKNNKDKIPIEFHYCYDNEKFFEKYTFEEILARLDAMFNDL